MCVSLLYIQLENYVKEMRVTALGMGAGSVGGGRVSRNLVQTMIEPALCHSETF